MYIFATAINLLNVKAMRKLFTMVVALAAFASSALALDNEPKEGITAQAFLGFNASKIRGLGYDGKIGGLAGFKFEYVLPKAHGTYINAGIDWTQKGAKRKFKDWPVGPMLISNGTGKYNLHYIEIPIHVGFHYNFNQDIGVFGEFGPYFGIGVGGKRKLTYDNDGTPFRDAEWDYKVFKKSTQPNRNNFQRWDAGLGFRVGAEYNQHYILALGCDWGLTDMWRDDFRDVEADRLRFLKDVKNFNFYMTLGYRF